MTAINYYRWSLLLPLLVPVLAIPSAQNSGDSDFVAAMLVACLTYGGAPYSLWAIYALWRLRGKTEKEARDLLFVAPCQVAPLMWLAIGIFGSYDTFRSGNASFSALTDGFIWHALHAVILGTTATASLGYLWVAYVDGTLQLLKRGGWVWSAPGDCPT